MEVFVGGEEGRLREKVTGGEGGGDQTKKHFKVLGLQPGGKCRLRGEGALPV